MISGWAKELPITITVCDDKGIILDMNDAAAEAFKKDGGLGLVGRNALDCHPEAARIRLQELLESGERNVYFIEKEGKRKLVCQTPWFEDGKYRGFVEFVLEVPPGVSTFIRG